MTDIRGCHQCHTYMATMTYGSAGSRAARAPLCVRTPAGPCHRTDSVNTHTHTHGERKTRTIWPFSILVISIAPVSPFASSRVSLSLSARARSGMCYGLVCGSNIYPEIPRAGCSNRSIVRVLRFCFDVNCIMCSSTNNCLLFLFADNTMYLSLEMYPQQCSGAPPIRGMVTYP